MNALFFSLTWDYVVSSGSLEWSLSMSVVFFFVSWLGGCGNGVSLKHSWAAVVVEVTCPVQSDGFAFWDPALCIKTFTVVLVVLPHCVLSAFGAVLFAGSTSLFIGLVSFSNWLSYSPNFILMVSVCILMVLIRT